MPRIRTLKPEHKQHRKVGQLDDRTYRLWVGLVTEADDEGRLVCDTEQLRVLIFGYQPDIHGALIEYSLNCLASIGLIVLYTVEGVRYACFPSWREHQRINRPSPSKLPPPPESFTEPSLNTHGALTGETQEDSRRIGRDRRGKERIGREGTGEGTGDGSPAPPRSLDAPFQINGTTPTEAEVRAMIRATAAKLGLPPKPAPEPEEAPPF